MNFKNDFALLGHFDIAPLQAKIAALSKDDWTADQERQAKFEAHTDTQTIKLLFDPDYRHQDPTPHPALDEFWPVIEPLLQHIEDNYKKTLRQRKTIAKHGPGYFIRIILTRLAPHSQITQHVDDGHSLKCCHRIHMPVVTNDQCVFHVGASSKSLHAGELWEINNRRAHAVDNDGDAARVHLIMDYVQPGERVFDIEGPLTA